MKRLEHRPNPAPSGSRCACSRSSRAARPSAVGGGVAEALFRDGLCLPSGTALRDADLARVAGVVRGTGRR